MEHVWNFGAGLAVPRGLKTLRVSLTAGPILDLVEHATRSLHGARGAWQGGGYGGQNAQRLGELGFDSFPGTGVELGRGCLKILKGRGPGQTLWECISAFASYPATCILWYLGCLNCRLRGAS